MTPEQINIAIAEECGWSHKTIREYTYWWHEENNKSLPPNDDGMRSCPNYHGDLNAMHEAVVFTIHRDPNLRRIYYQTLDTITGDQWNTIDATAAQRAEAFLKVKGKWKE